MLNGNRASVLQDEKVLEISVNIPPNSALKNGKDKFYGVYFATIKTKKI